MDSLLDLIVAYSSYLSICWMIGAGIEPELCQKDVTGMTSIYLQRLHRCSSGYSYLIL